MDKREGKHECLIDMDGNIFCKLMGFPLQKLYVMFGNEKIHLSDCDLISVEGVVPHLCHTYRLKVSHPSLPLVFFGDNLISLWVRIEK